MNSYSYLLDKIQDCTFTTKPFKFLYIENFLNDDDFIRIINEQKFKTTGKDFEELCNSLNKKGWEAHPHPGTFKNIQSYKKWRYSNLRNEQDLTGDIETRNLCEGTGMAFRLKEIPNYIAELKDLFLSDEFMNCVQEKFDLESSFNCKTDCGFQKYLSGYEISPHPDVREKALTWMLNLNESNSENENYHTHFMKFKKQKSYIYDLWENYQNIQRQWVPWDWCETDFLQRKNNSITIFSPSSYTLHSVRAVYNDIESQRTQLYGNIWYDRASSKNMPNYLPSSYRDLDYEITIKESLNKGAIKKSLKKILFYIKKPQEILNKIK